MVSQKSALTDHEFTLMAMLVLGRRQQHGGGREIVEERGKTILIWPYLGLNCCSFCALMYLLQVPSLSGYHRLSLLLFHFLADYIHTSAPTSQPYQYFTCYCKCCQNSFLSSKTQKYFAWSLLLLFQTWRALVCPKHCLFSFQLYYLVYKRYHLQDLSCFKKICVFPCQLKLGAMFPPVAIHKIMEINSLLIVNNWC